MLNADKGSAEALNGRKLHIGIVQSRFNQNVTNGLLQACESELAALKVPTKQIRHLVVPGALEIPVALKWLAHSGKYEALIALGCVIRGETYHFELVANEAAAGITRVALDYGVPIANAVLATENLDQATVRQIEKGRDAARAAVEMALLREQIA